MSKYAISGDDLYGLRSERIRALFTPEELNNLRDQVRLNVIPKLENLLIDRQNQFDDQDSEDHMQSILETFETIQEEFQEEAEIAEEAETQIGSLKAWIEDNKTESSLEPREKLSQESTNPQHTSERSIFDDVDAM